MADQIDNGQQVPQDGSMPSDAGSGSSSLAGLVGATERATKAEASPQPGERTGVIAGLGSPQSTQSGQASSQSRPQVAAQPSRSASPAVAAAAQSGRPRQGKQATPSVPKARRMKLSLTKIDPWSVAKVSFLLSIAFGIIQIVAVTVLWYLLQSVGLFDSLNTVISRTGLSSGNLTAFLGLGTILSWVTILAVFEVILIVILSTVAAFLYNVTSALVGGVHVTLGDD